MNAKARNRSAYILFLSSCLTLTGGIASNAQTKGDPAPDRGPRPVVRGEPAVTPPKAPAPSERAPHRPVQPDRGRPERPAPSRPGPADIDVPSRPEMPAPARKPSADATPERTRPVERPGDTDTPGLERAGPPLDVIDRQRVGDLFREEQIPDGFGHDLPEAGKPGTSPFDRHGIEPRERGMPQREMPGKDMGPAGAARQQPDVSVFDERRGGPGTVSGGCVVDPEGEQWTGHYDRETNTVLFVQTYPAGGASYVRVYDNDTGRRLHSFLIANSGIIIESSLKSWEPGEGPKLSDSGYEDCHQDDDDEEVETRPGDPDDWGTEEPLPEDRFGIVPGPTVRTPTDPFADEEEHESVHAPRPERDAEAEAAERAEQVGDRRERGPQDISIQFVDPLRDPPRDVDQSAP